LSDFFDTALKLLRQTIERITTRKLRITTDIVLRGGKCVA